MQHFHEFQIPRPLQQALDSIGFKTPTPIQAQAIPVALKRHDLIGCAQTGTGKTAAFAIPTVVNLLKDPSKIGLILAPTRELAQQIEQVARNLTRYTREIRIATLVGGAPMHPQVKALAQKPRLLIATPGRLIDHLNRKTARLGQVDTLVLDEADRMLDMGFAPQLAKILQFIPQNRQTLLFSATWDGKMDSLSKTFLKNPVRVSVDPSPQAAKTVRQSTISTTSQRKNETLLDELNQREGSILVFTRTKARTDRLTRYLESYGLEVGRIHGGRTQSQRNSALAQFRAGKVRILVATDIAARGIDVARIAHVINYDLPQLAEDYIHRIGRTGRAGSDGNAVSFVTPEDKSQWRLITLLLKKGGSPGATQVQRGS